MNMKLQSKLLDFSSGLTVFLTLFFFAIAAVEKGLTHDLLLEAGVFLVSLKLIIASVKTAEAEKRLEERLEKIEQLLKGRS